MSAGKAGTLLPELADCCALRTEPSARKMSGTHRKFRFREFMPSSDSAYALAFRFALLCFIAAEIRLRAAALMRRRFLTLAGLAWLPLGGRPRRAGREPSPTRAAIACSIRLASCLRCVTML